MNIFHLNSEHVNEPVKHLITGMSFINYLNKILVVNNNGNIIPVSIELKKYTSLSSGFTFSENDKLSLYYAQSNTALLYCLKIAREKLYDITKWIDYQIELRQEFTTTSIATHYNHELALDSLKNTAYFVDNYIINYKKQKTKQLLISNKIPFESKVIKQLLTTHLDMENGVLSLGRETLHFVKKASQEYYILKKFFDYKGIPKNLSFSLSNIVSEIKTEKLTKQRLYSQEDALKAVSKLNNKIKKHFKINFNFIAKIKNKNKEKELGNITINTEQIDLN